MVEIPDEEGGLGGCAAAGDVVFLGALDGQRVHVVPLDEPRRRRPGTPRSSSAGSTAGCAPWSLDAEGALWITTSNRDGVGTPAEDDDKVLRILPPSAEGDSPL